jgi:hypothetical protein
VAEQARESDDLPLGSSCQEFIRNNSGGIGRNLVVLDTQVTPDDWAHVIPNTDKHVTFVGGRKDHHCQVRVMNTSGTTSALEGV